MPNFDVQVVLNGSSGLSTDRYVNTFTFSGVGTHATNHGLIWARIDSFYNDPHSGHQALSSYLSNDVIDGEVRTYDKADAEPRVPIITPLTPFAARGSASDQPHEVAVTISFHGVPPVTPRRRGRIFFGPLNNSSDAGLNRPADTMLQAMRAAGQALSEQSTSDLEWVIYSPTSGQYTIVTAGWIDDAWDTMRSRGNLPTMRRTWPI